MDPTLVFCLNWEFPSSGYTSQGNIGPIYTRTRSLSVRSAIRPSGHERCRLLTAAHLYHAKRCSVKERLSQQSLFRLDRHALSRYK
jgi:hypothetical protein